MTTRLEDVAKALVDSPKLVLATHENPDGDAIGSLSALHRMLVADGHDALMLLGEGDDPGEEYFFLVDWDQVVREAPPASEGHTIVLLDCGNAERSAAKDLDLTDRLVINLDHHHDNTRFGTHNFVMPEASCTAEIVWMLADLMNLEIDKRTAESLYVGLITDTGRFMYGTASSKAHLMAADLISKGVDVPEIFQRIYEGIAIERIEFLARALGKIEQLCEGSLALVWLSRDDYDEVGAPDGWSEGIIDYLRSIEGTRVAAVIREPKNTPLCKRISLRSADDGVDVSAIARSGGGGGHVRAAGFSSELDREQLIKFISDGIAEQIGSPPPRN